MPQTTLLIVDSHPVLCQALETLLSDVPDVAVVGSANDVVSAEQMVEELSPAVVILNSSLGITNCALLVEHLHSTGDGPAVVFLSSNDQPESDEMAASPVGSAVILREASLQDLIAAIRWAHLGDMWISPTLLTNLISEMRTRLRQAHEVHLGELTAREGEILELLVQGLSQRAIATELGLSLNTVRTHTRNIQTKLNVHSNIEAVSVALDRGIRPN